MAPGFVPFPRVSLSSGAPSVPSGLGRAHMFLQGGVVQQGACCREGDSEHPAS